MHIRFSGIKSRNGCVYEKDQGALSSEQEIAGNCASVPIYFEWSWRFGNAGKEHDEGVFEEGIPICASYDELATQRVFSGYM